MERVGAPGTGSAGVTSRDARDLFISYSSADEQVAREMRRHLEQAGYTCWMAPDDVRGMDPWAEQILEAIEGCRVMVVLLSASANASRHVSREVNLALGRGKAILPVRIEAVPPEGALEYLLSLVQRVDAFPPPFRSHLEQIQAHLAAVLAESGTLVSQPAGSSPSGGVGSTGRRRKRVDSRVVGALGGVAIGLALLIALVIAFSPPAGPAASASPGAAARWPITTAAELETAIRAGLRTPAEGSPHSDFVTRTDLTRQLSAQLPADWLDVSGTAFLNFAGQPVGVHLAASVDLGHVYDDSFSVPGFFVGASSDEAPGFDPGVYLGAVRPNTTYGCEMAGRHPVRLDLADGLYEGTLVTWRACRAGQLSMTQAALLREDGAVSLVIDMRALDGADAAALRRAIETLTVPPRVFTPAGSPATPTPGPPG